MAYRAPPSGRFSGSLERRYGPTCPVSYYSQLWGRCLLLLATLYFYTLQSFAAVNINFGEFRFAGQSSHSASAPTGLSVSELVYIGIDKVMKFLIPDDAQSNCKTF